MHAQGQGYECTHTHCTHTHTHTHTHTPQVPDSRFARQIMVANHRVLRQMPSFNDVRGVLEPDLNKIVQEINKLGYVQEAYVGITSDMCAASNAPDLSPLHALASYICMH